jgi:hypothetical protein
VFGGKINELCCLPGDMARDLRVLVMLIPALAGELKGTLGFRSTCHTTCNQQLTINSYLCPATYTAEYCTNPTAYSRKTNPFSHRPSNNRGAHNLSRATALENRATNQHVTIRSYATTQSTTSSWGARSQW